MTKKLFLLLIFLSIQILKAQDNQTVTLTVNGQGKTLDAANQNALRNAIEQSFGTFISSKTELLNDSLLTDEISSISNGNIQKYDVLSKSQLPDGSWTTILKVVVSVTKLTSFVEAKGVTVEFKGSLFAVNIKQQLLNEQGEIKAIQNMTKVLLNTILQSFDYSIKTEEPKSLDAESKNWILPITVTALANKNSDFIKDYIVKNLSFLSLSKEQLANYQTLNKDIFIVHIDDKVFYLRTHSSFRTLAYFFKSWEIYVKNYKLLLNNLEAKGTLINSNDELFISKIPRKVNREFMFHINPKGTKVAIFNLNLRLTLPEIEKMTNITIERGNLNDSKIKVGDFHESGIVFYVDNSGQHGMIVSPFFIDYFDFTENGSEVPSHSPHLNIDWIPWANGERDKYKYLYTLKEIGTGKENTRLIIENFKENKTAAMLCSILFFNGYSNWYLPSINELELIAKQRFPFFQESYWSSSEESQYTAYLLLFKNEFNKSEVDKKDKSLYNKVLPIRSF